MYNILLADDELPAQRFLETIITKHAPDFTVVRKCRDGASALSWIKDNPDSIDLLLTDIRMPDMDGITLAKEVRKISESIHIVIVSGYSEFEYAKGAIAASVDDYILKPVSVAYMKELLQNIKDKLDGATSEKLSEELVLMLNSREYDEGFIDRAFGKDNYYFSLIRIGNVCYPQADFLNTCRIDDIISRINSDEDPDQDGIMRGQINGISVYLGRDSSEYILFSKADSPISHFQNVIEDINNRIISRTVTSVSSRTGMSFAQIGDFYTKASKVLRHAVIIGHHTNVYIDHKSGKMQIPAGVFKRLAFCVGNNERSTVQKIFSDLGRDWDRQKVTQRQTYIMMQQLIHTVQSVRLDQTDITDEIIAQADALTNTSSSYSEMMDSLYNILYNPEERYAGQLTPEEMYHYAVRTIEDKFAQQLSIQTVCSEIGISQTYLSRLFRRYGDTSFNSYLIRCRMENAKKLMKEQPQMPLHQVALCSGYEDYAYFSKVFRQNTGCTPSQYQTEIKAK